MENSSSTPRSDEAPASSGLRLRGSDQGAAETMQARIAETAERLFRQFGYQKTTVADIAEELEMSPANVYRFFASKAAICEAVVRKVASEARARVQEEITAPDLSATERLRQLVHLTNYEVADRCISDKRMHAVMHAAVEQNWAVFHEHQESIRKMTATIIADGVSSGEFDVSDVELASQCFLAAMISSCHPLILENRLNAGEDVKATVEPMVSFALRALGASEPQVHSQPS